jgi:hypothetical protein
VLVNATTCTVDSDPISVVVKPLSCVLVSAAIWVVVRFETMDMICFRSVGSFVELLLLTPRCRDYLKNKHL